MTVSYYDRKRSQCCYLIGEVRDMTCCGEPIDKGVYCLVHRERCHLPGTPPKLKLTMPRGLNVADDPAVSGSSLW